MRARVVLWGLAAMVMAGAALVSGAPVAGASGGGGCGGPVTDWKETTIEISGACFRPTVARVPVGARVTWTNLDPYPHTVLGANGAWGGYNELRKNRSATYSFPEAGVYPFVCTIHPGMMGTVVVGSGAAMSAATLDVRPGLERTASRTAAGSDLGWRLGTFAGFGLLAATGVRRRLRRRAASS